MTIFNAQITVASENSLIVYFGEQAGQRVSDEISQQIQFVKQLILTELGEHIVELIPSYASLLVTFDPLNIDHHLIRQLLNQSQNNVDLKQNSLGRSVELPVYYGDEVGLDLMRIAEHSGLSIEQVIAKHQQQSYRVFAIGFAPGFGYLGQVDEQIAMPRLATPRSNVPKGAVAIADRQTAVYPAESPGGWNIIGRCPIDMFTATAEPAMPFDVGDIVTFKQINQAEFIALGGTL